jgi:hypothetical protein
MNLDDLLGELEQLTPEQFGYLGLLAVFGPILLRLIGFKTLSRLIRPLALLALAAGLYARQQHLSNSFRS